MREGREPTAESLEGKHTHTQSQRGRTGEPPTRREIVTFPRRMRIRERLSPRPPRIMQEDMAPRGHGEFETVLQGSRVRCGYTVHQDFAVALEFQLRGRPYSFRLTKWKQRGQGGFLPLFFDYRVRDAATFGTMRYDADTLPVYERTEAQHVAVVVQAAKDVMRCLDQIVGTLERSVLDYAVFYRERHTETNTYSQYITLVCCHCITHANFLAPQVNWPLVQFAPGYDAATCSVEVLRTRDLGPQCIG